MSVNYRRAAIVASVLAVVFLTPMTAAYALWSRSATATLGVSVATPTPATPPSEPSNFRCTGFDNNNQVRLSWNAVTPAPSEYRVYRTGSALYLTTTSTALVADRSFWSINNGVSTPFIVKAYTAAGESGASNTVNVTFGSSRTCSPVGAP